MVSSNRLLDLFGVELPIIQAPMAGATTPEMVVAVSNAGGLGSLPTAVYGLSLLMPGLAWRVLQTVIIRTEGETSPMKAYVGRDAKVTLSMFVYVVGIALSFIAPWAALLCYGAVALTWLMPDKRIERMTEHG